MFLRIFPDKTEHPNYGFDEITIPADLIDHMIPIGQPGGVWITLKSNNNETGFREIYTKRLITQVNFITLDFMAPVTTQ